MIKKLIESFGWVERVRFDNMLVLAAIPLTFYLIFTSKPVHGEELLEPEPPKVEEHLDLLEQLTFCSSTRFPDHFTVNGTERPLVCEDELTRCFVAKVSHVDVESHEDALLICFSADMGERYRPRLLSHEEFIDAHWWIPEDTKRHARCPTKLPGVELKKETAVASNS